MFKVFRTKEFEYLMNKLLAKEQQETIDKIKEFLPEFRRLMEELIKSI